MKKLDNSKKIVLLSVIIITFFTVGIVPKQFQNDTFFNISIGKYILNNGIDMQEHFSWVSGLTYTYSHWAFDIIIYLLYNCFNFDGIYIGVIIFSILINITVFTLLTKTYKSPIISLVITLISSYIIRDAFTARSQIISFLCFIIEIYCLEQFIKTNKKKYPTILVVLSIIVANFHAATWPLFLVLFMPYLACGFFSIISYKNIYEFCAKLSEKKLQRVEPSSPKAEVYRKDIDDYLKLSKKKFLSVSSRLKLSNDYNFKNLLILFIIISFTGLLTPIHGVPYTYIINSMFGTSNFENNVSIDFINEMQPIVPGLNLAFLCFTSLIIAFTTFMPTKLKVEHAFLIIGLYIMTLSSSRYVYLLVFLGTYPLCDLTIQCINKNKMQLLENKVTIIICCFILVFVCVFSIFKINDRLQINYVNESLYPIGAVNYIKSNLNYKNIKIYNSYNNGSYLMLNDIPVFIDSRLDVYCSEFNNTNVFRDYIYASNGTKNYEDIFSEYGFTHILLYKDEIIAKYIINDSNYKLLYEDDYFLLYEKI